MSKDQDVRVCVTADVSSAVKGLKGLTKIVRELNRQLKEFEERAERIDELEKAIIYAKINQESGTDVS